MQTQINYLAIAVAVVLTQILGALWYSRALFGKAWMAAVGKSEEDIKQGGMAVPLIGSILLSLVMAFVLAHLVSHMEEKTMFSGIQAACWIWAGFIATTMGINHLFQGTTLRLYLIDSGYHLVSLAIMGAVFGAW
jgi:hypothetical protein